MNKLLSQRRKLVIIFGFVLILICAPMNFIGEQVEKNRDHYVILTSLEHGWNLVSIPYNTSLIKTDLTVNHDDTNYTWNEAVSNGLISDYIFTWNAHIQSYEINESTNPQYGYWMYAYDSCQLYGNVLIQGEADEDWAWSQGTDLIGDIYHFGNVSIGSSTANEKLDVTGTIKMTGFKMQTGASDGYVLTCDDLGMGTWQEAASGDISGSGTSNYIPKFTDATIIEDSEIYETGGNIGIGTTNPTNKVHIYGSSYAPLLNIEKDGSGRGVRVSTTSACALWVEDSGNHGLRVTDANGDGVHVTTAGGWAGYFGGDVQVTGMVNKGGGSFAIDHPLDPENKYLYHSFVESPDMKNVYDGVIILDENGEAMVELPDYFEALNKDFRYQLTCIGSYAPVYISKEISDNSFSIAGGKSGMKVSWQVTGIRKDLFAENNRIQVEVNKSVENQGKYLHPEIYGLDEQYSIYEDTNK